MLAAIAKPLLVSTVYFVSASPMPSFGIERICQSTVVIERDHAALHACRHDERGARNDLRARWSQIPARYRAACTGSETEIWPSYVDLSECIQSYMDVDKQPHHADPYSITD